MHQTVRSQVPVFTEEDSTVALRELRDRWRVVSRPTQTNDIMEDVASAEGNAVSRQVGQSYKLQRNRTAMWEDDRLYATFAEDPRELDDIVLDRD